jgi:NADP-dependent isocitrate dehydrogenase
VTASYNGIPLPSSGTKITFDGKFVIPDNPIIPFIEGDGTGRDIWKASVRVFDAAVDIAYNGKRRVAWYEVFAGEKAMDRFKTWLPDDTVAAFRDLRIGIKGPLTTPVGGGIRSLNVALRQILDLYACVRPVKYYQGIPSPVKHPHRMNMVIFRENTEDVYAGIEWKEGTAQAKELIDFINNKMLAGTNKHIREDSGIGIKPISDHGNKAPGAHGHQVRAGQQSQVGDDRAQGQHPEVHRRRVSASGDTSWRRRSSATRLSPSARAGSSTTSTRIPACRWKTTPSWSSPAWSSRRRISATRCTRKCGA